jgi:hypothetical protein
VVLGGLLCAVAHAQSTSSHAAQTQAEAAKSPVDLLVDQLVENAAHYRAALPSLTAHEEIQSEASRLILHTSAKAEAVMRVVRDPLSGELKESRQITVLNGKPVPPDQKVQLPMLMFGGFGSFQEEFFKPSERGCFVFSLMPQRHPSDPLELRIVPGPDVVAGCSAVPKPGELEGKALVDVASHQLLHLERTIDPAFAGPRHIAPFAAVDLAPAKIGEQTFWLPTMVDGRILMGKQKGEMGDLKGRFTAHYSDYHRFTATATMVSAGPAEDAPASPAPASR